MKRLAQLLTDLVINPFDDVRNISSAILKDMVVSFSSNVRDSIAVGDNRASLDHGQCDTLRANEWPPFSLALSRAENMMYQSGRADYADGVGRLYDMIYGCHIEHNWFDSGVYSGFKLLESLLLALENDIRISKENLRLAVSTAPLHGHLIALR